MTAEGVTTSFEGGPRNLIRPPENELTVAYVVPIQGEVRNGNVFHQLKDYSRQNIAPEAFEVIYVVNNSIEDASNRTDAFAENERLFSILEFASGKTSEPPDGLAPWEFNAANAARSRDVRIQIIDLSTQGMQEKNIQAARTIGDNLAVKR